VKLVDQIDAQAVELGGLWAFGDRQAPIRGCASPAPRRAVVTSTPGSRKVSGTARASLEPHCRKLLGSSEADAFVPGQDGEGKEKHAAGGR